MKYIALVLLTCSIFSNAFSQDKKQQKMSLDDAIEMASQNSIDAFRIANMYRASYWEYRYYKADRLPTLTLSATPIDFNRYRTREYNFQTNEEEYVQREYLSSDFALSLTQNIALTGGSFFLSSDLGMVKNLGDSQNDSYQSTPISIGYQQSLNGYNALKWRTEN